MSGPTSGGRRGRRTAIVAVVVAVAIVGAAIWVLRPSSPTGSGPTPVGSGIDLLPSPTTPSGCITGTPGVPRPTYNLDEGVFQANTYDVPSGTTGHVGMCYDAETGSMFAYANWSQVGAAGGWFSYPQVTYGVNFWDGAFSTYTNQSSTWALPQTVASVASGNDWFTINYDFNAPPTSAVTGYDLSLDDFFTETLPPQYEVGPFVEVETFLAHNISYPFQYVHWSTATLRDGILSVQPWDVGWWCHGVDNGTNANVSFDFSYDGQATKGLSAGELGVNLSALLVEVEALMPAVSCWTGPTGGFSAFHLDEANLGSEDGAVGGASFNYNWTIDDYCIHPDVSSPNAQNLSCVASTSGGNGAGSPGPSLGPAPGLFAAWPRRPADPTGDRA